MEHEITAKMEDSEQNQKPAQNGVDSIFDGLPEEERKVVTKMFEMSITSSPQVELMRNMTPENINSFIEMEKEQDLHNFQEGRERKIFQFAALVAVLIFTAIAIYMLKDHTDTLEKILYGMGGLITGALGGYGYGKTQKDD